MKKLKFILLVMLLAFPFVMCQSKTETKETVAATTPSSPVVEVLYLHGPQRCRTCVALEKATKEVLETKFTQQIKNGKVIFRDIDLSTKEGEKIGDKYEVAWSSLIIVRKDGKKEKVTDMTDDGFRYAINNKAKIQALIQQKINDYLK